MFTISLLLLIQSAFWSLRLGISGGSFPRILKPEEEAQLLAEAWQGDKRARDKLIEHNLRLVAHICKKYFSRAEQEDLISIGTIGLIKAIDTYKSDKNTRLATYAARCIENEILMQFRRDRKQQREISLNVLLETEDGDGGLTIIDTIADESTELLDSISLKENCERLRSLIKIRLNPREAKILEYRYGLNGAAPLTQTEVGSLLGISRSYVSRIEKKAVEKLRVDFE